MSYKRDESSLNAALVMLDDYDMLDQLSAQAHFYYENGYDPYYQILIDLEERGVL